MKTEDLLAMTVDDCLAHLRSSSSGLSTGEAALRQKRYGMNEIAEASRYRGLAAFLGHLKNPLVIILLIAAIISAFVGEIVQV
ncbi:cation-transporting P-type ATPase [Methanoculleus bourgensis]|uniref:cation-transporting P-type ATPase n=1 Tax=Methanoculleus bourgensis TaxID=83986 RepID=UPI0007816DBE|nr:cation-transporting P-type ATPase [Methanoculleus bourgensis]